MTSITTYTPFTYCLTFLPTGKRYYGSRYSKKEVAHPSQLWTTYFTSSKIIADLIEEYGKDSFSIQIRKTFIDRDSAIAWETKFLTRINAAKHPEWLNGNNGDEKFYNSPESTKKGLETKKKNGTLNSNSPESIQKCKDTKKSRGIESPMKNPETVQRMLDTKKDRGIEHPMKNSDFVQKVKNTKIKNGTTNPNTPESIQKMLDTRKERGILNPFSVPFLSIIETKKSYSKPALSRWIPHFKQYY